MNERHRQLNFKSPLETPELELDPEKLLWKPGVKKFFIPEAPKIVNLTVTEVPLYTPYAPLSLSEIGMRALDMSVMRDFYSRIAECVPGRDEFIVPERSMHAQARPPARTNFMPISRRRPFRRIDW